MIRRFLFVFSFCLIFLVATLPAWAQERILPASAQQVTLSYAPVVKQVVPAVVNIYTKKTVRQRVASPLFDDPLFRQFFGEQFPAPGLTRERVQRSLGSGVIVRSDGFIVTNLHVINGSEAITVVLSDRRELDAKVISVDKKTDLALLKVEAKDGALPFLELRDSDTLEVGDIVLAIGNPFGVGQTVTHGIVSALARTAVGGAADYQYFIQTDAPINPGNSGGALVTLDGKLVGINTAIYSRSGGSIGIGFATPSNMVRALTASLEHKGRIIRPWFGAGMQSITPDIAQSLGLPSPSGVIIRHVYPGSPASEGGLEVGDIISGVDGHMVADALQLRGRIASYEVGRKVTLRIIRAGRTLDIPVRMVPPPETPPRDTRILAGKQPLAGAAVNNLSPAVASEMDVDIVATGVVIIGVKPHTPAAAVGFKPRDIVLSINGEKITSTRQLEAVLAEGSVPSWRIVFRREDKILEAVASR